MAIAFKSENDRLLYAYGSGTTDYGRSIIVMQTENFIVFRTPGRVEWAGVGSRAYYPSHTVLIAKGVWCLRGDREEWYGRVSKKFLKERIDLAESIGKCLAKTWQDVEPTHVSGL